MKKPQKVSNGSRRRILRKMGLAATVVMVVSLVFLSSLFTGIASAQTERRSLSFSGNMNGEDVLDTGWVLMEMEGQNFSSAVFAIWPFNR